MAVDSLSSYPPIDKGKLGDYNQVCIVDEIKATFNGAENQGNSNETCVPAADEIFRNISEVESQLQYDYGERSTVLSQKNVFDDQMKQSWIKRLI